MPTKKVKAFKNKEAFNEKRRKHFLNSIECKIMEIRKDVLKLNDNKVIYHYTDNSSNLTETSNDDFKPYIHENFKTILKDLYLQDFIISNSSLVKTWLNNKMK